MARSSSSVSIALGMKDHGAARRRITAVSALLGLLSGAFSSATMLLSVPWVSANPVIWLPGAVFGLCAILPISVRIHDPWWRTIAGIVASSLVYPVAYEIASDSAIDHSTAYIVASLAFSGFIGSLALAGSFLGGRPGWLSSAAYTVSIGTLAGAALAAFLLVPTYHPSISLRLAVILIVWQTAVAAFLGRGTLRMPNKITGANAGGQHQLPMRTRWAARVAQFCRSVKHSSLHLPRRTSGSPEKVSHDSAGQANLRASVALGLRHPEIPELCWGETDTPASRARWPSPGVPAFFRPVGALGDSGGFATQGGVPRRLGTGPGLSSLAPLGLGPPNQTRQPTPGERLGSHRTPAARHGCARRWLNGRARQRRSVA